MDGWIDSSRGFAVVSVNSVRVRTNGLVLMGNESVFFVSDVTIKQQVFVYKGGSSE